MSSAYLLALKENTLNKISGRNSVGKATKDDVSGLFGHIEALEALLDEADGDDVFGTEGWRHYLNLDED